MTQARELHAITLGATVLRVFSWARYTSTPSLDVGVVAAS